jgi:hypothetical protein
MRTMSKYLIPLWAVGTLAVAIAAAPIAVADPDAPPSPAQPHQACTTQGGNICQSPGNAQINDAPPPVQFYPYGGEALLL